MIKWIVLSAAGLLILLLIIALVAGCILSGRASHKEENDREP